MRRFAVTKIVNAYATFAVDSFCGWVSAMTERERLTAELASVGGLTIRQAEEVYRMAYELAQGSEYTTAEILDAICRRVASGQPMQDAIKSTRDTMTQPTNGHSRPAARG